MGARRVMLGVGIDAYEHLRPLKRAVADVRDVTRRFEESGFEVVTLLDARRAAIAEALGDPALAGLDQPGSVLVVLWAGHAARNQSGALRLFAVDNRESDPDLKLITVDQLAQAVASTRARQILLILDTCYSGAGTVDAAAVIDAIQSRLEDADHRWVGILASARDYERAVDGVLVRKLVRLLDHGPSDARLRLRWNPYQARLRGDDLIDALVREWDDEWQRPKRAELGVAVEIVRNPLYREGASEGVVEHLLWTARGGGSSEAGFWFTGRERSLLEIVAWLGRGEPGLCVVTGPPGSGKSAVAGRIVSLSDPAERAQIRGAQGLPPAALDPGERSVDAHLHVRGATLERLAGELAAQLGVVGRREAVHPQEVLAAVGTSETPPLIVVDALDEAGNARFGIAADFLAPLARYARLVVASREVAGGEASLLESLGAAGLWVDVDADEEATGRDVHDYVLARLRGRDERMDPETVADAIEGSFLLARILTSQLMAAPADTSAAGWRDRLSETIEEAFRRDLEHDERAVGLLTALAYAYGPGFPAEDVWPAVATALSPSGAEYSRSDALLVLGTFGRYVTVSSLRGQAVYRLHQRLADVLSTDRAATATTAVLSAYEQHLARGMPADAHAYLWQFAWEHAIDGEAAGVQALEALSARYGTLRRALGFALGNLAIRYRDAGKTNAAIELSERTVAVFETLASERPAQRNELGGVLVQLGTQYGEVGRHVDAIAPIERGVAIQEELAGDNPAFLADLANSLTLLGIAYGDVGRFAEALPLTERAVAIEEQRVAEDARLLADLARALINLGNRYHDVGRHAESLATAERVVALYDQLADETPGSLAHRAVALTNLGEHYSRLGRPGEAVASAERAVEILERLADASPIHVDHLAAALNNLGLRYGALGRPDDAVAVTQRAVALLEQLAADNPASTLQLARVLNSLGAHYIELGRPGDALTRLQRAVDLYDKQTVESPADIDAFGEALSTLAMCHYSLHRPSEAIALAERAVGLRAQTAAESPAFRGGLADSLINLGAVYAELGRHNEALAVTEDAASILEQLTAENPALLDKLARALNNLGSDYGAVGRDEDALASVTRAVTLYEQLADDNPAVAGQLATALGSLGVRYSALGRHDEALAPTLEAVTIRERLTAERDEDPARLTAVLARLSHVYSELGRDAEALDVNLRGAAILEPLAGEDPARLATLAGVLNNLGANYAAVERYADALTATERAIALYEPLAAANPAWVGELAGALSNFGLWCLRAGDLRRRDRGWALAEERFAADPHAIATLRARRWRPREEFKEAVGDLVEALRHDDRTDPALTGEIHAALRSLRSQRKRQFDRAWHGPLPDWLTLKQKVVDACLDWLNARSFVESRDVLRANARLILSPDAEIALAEIALSNPDDPGIAARQELLAACRREGIDAAYHPMLIGEVVANWRAIENTDEAKRFLDAHRATLLAPEALQFAEETEDNLGSAILKLLAEDRLDLAHRLLDDPEQILAVLADGRRDASPPALFALARVAADAHPPTGIVHHAIALVLAEHPADALEALDELDDDADVAPLIVDLTDAITHRPRHAPGIAALIRKLSE